MTVFDSLDFAVTGVFLPIGAFLVSAFAGWRISEKMRVEEYGAGSPLYRLWTFLVRFVVPAGMVLVFVL